MNHASGFIIGIAQKLVKILIEHTANEIFKTTFNSFKLYKNPAKCLLIVFNILLIFWNITKTFLKFQYCEKPRFLHLLIIIITSTSDLQPSTVIMNQLLGKSV